MTAVDVAALRASVAEAADALAASPCIFFACPGPDEPFVDMATCKVCAAAQDVRAALVLLDAADPTPRALGKDPE